jgi:hypothetical protein
MNKNKIKGVGLDCSSLSYRPSPEFLPDYLYLDPLSNTSLYLEGLTEGRELIVVSGKRDLIDGVLSDLGRSEIAVLLLPTDQIDEWDDIKGLLDEFRVESVGISRPENLEQLMKATEKIKKVIVPSYLSLPLSPIHYQKELIDWAEQEGLEIIGTDYDGSWINSANVINSFSLPFLLSFAAAHSHLVLLPSRDLVGTENQRAYLEELIGEETGKETEMSNTVLHSPKQLPKLIHTAITSESGIIPYENPYYLISPSELMTRMKEIKPKIEGEMGKSDDIVKQVMKSVADFNSFILPPTNSQLEYLSMVRPKLVKELKKAFGEKARIEQAKIGETTFLISVTTQKREKRYLWKDKVIEEIHTFILYMDDSGFRVKEI